MAENVPKEGQRLEFQTEVKQLLQLMIHSLYTNKEVFIRELISNASDALDKVRFESLTDKNILGDDTDFRISIKLDKNAKILTITDNGIGMNREEVIQNIGTIARSGSKAFVEAKSAFDELAKAVDTMGAIVPEDELLATLAKDEKGKNRFRFLLVVGAAFFRERLMDLVLSTDFGRAERNAIVDHRTQIDRAFHHTAACCFVS